MKRLAAILLLVLFLFNLIGFKWVFDYALQQSDKHFASEVDTRKFDEKDLVAVRVPLFMPYQTAHRGFERTYGSVTISGTVYKYVGRKIDNGELVLYCLKDERGSSLLKARDKYFSDTNGLYSDRSSQNRHSSNDNDAQAPGFNLGDYDDFVAGYAFSASSPAILYALPSNDASSVHGTGFLPEEPPECLIQA